MLSTIYYGSIGQYVEEIPDKKDERTFWIIDFYTFQIPPHAKIARSYFTQDTFIKDDTSEKNDDVMFWCWRMRDETTSLHSFSPPFFPSLLFPFLSFSIH